MSIDVMCAVLALACILACGALMFLVMAGASLRTLTVVAGVAVALAAGAVTFRLIAAY